MKKRRNLTLILMMLLLSLMVPMTASAAVKISQKTVTLVKGQSTTLKIIGTKKTVKWKTSNKKVAAVTGKGKVLAKSSGNAVISALVKGKTYTCRVTVKNVSSNTRRKNFVKAAASWLGTKELDARHRQIIDLYNACKPLPRSYPVKYTDAWCATFVSAIAIKCKMTDIIPRECSCGEMIRLFQQLGEWQENDAYRPKLGDIIFYCWSDSGIGDNRGWANHVGIVESVKGSTITVIEGNMQQEPDPISTAKTTGKTAGKRTAEKPDIVGRRTIKVNDRYIRGYGVPRF